MAGNKNQKVKRRVRTSIKKETVITTRSWQLSVLCARRRCDNFACTHSIAADSLKPPEQTIDCVNQILDYMDTNQNVVAQNFTPNMILNVHSDACRIYQPVIEEAEQETVFFWEVYPEIELLSSSIEILLLHAQSSSLSHHLPWKQQQGIISEHT